jgi:hypothetical protein
MTTPVRYCRHSRVLWRRLANAVVVLGPHADKPTAISGPAAEIWDLLALPTTLDDAAAHLAAAHAAPAADVRRDIEPVLERLVREGAVERRS